MMVKRVMGKASFIKLHDRTTQIQVRLERDRLPEGVTRRSRNGTSVTSSVRPGTCSKRKPAS